MVVAVGSLFGLGFAYLRLCVIANASSHKISSNHKKTENCLLSR